MIYLKHKNNIFILTFLILNVTVQYLYSQQDISFNQYMFSHQDLNPAYSGSKSGANITSLSRTQWVGFEGAPLSQSVSFNTPIRSKNLGIGMSGLVDRIGPLNTTVASLDFSYHLKFSSQQKWLSVGLKLGAQSFSLDTNSLLFFDRNDPFLTNNYNNEFIPNIGFGVYYYSPKFYFGFSVPRMIEDESVFIKRHFYFIGGVLIPFGYNLQLKPSILLKKTNGVALTYDLSSLLVFNKSYWFGPQFKSQMDYSSPNQVLEGSLSFLAGINLTKNISVGYAYGNVINLGINNLSSHEVLLRFDFSPKSIGALRSPRIF